MCECTVYGRIQYSLLLLWFLFIFKLLEPAMRKQPTYAHPKLSHSYESANALAIRHKMSHLTVLPNDSSKPALAAAPAPAPVVAPAPLVAGSSSGDGCQQMC